MGHTITLKDTAIRRNRKIAIEVVVGGVLVVVVLFFFFVWKSWLEGGGGRWTEEHFVKVFTSNSNSHCNSHSCMCG